MTRHGRCNCGAVELEISNEVKETGACHCGMCRRFSGGIYMAVKVPSKDLKITNDKGLSIFESSSWAERAFCKFCGSSLFYRVTAPGPENGVAHVGMGILTDTSGITLTGEIFVDQKPDGYSFAEPTHKMTEAEVMAMFAPPSE